MTYEADVERTEEIGDDGWWDLGSPPTEETFLECLKTGRTPPVMSEEQFKRYLEIKMPRWIEEVEEETRREAKRAMELARLFSTLFGI